MKKRISILEKLVKGKLTTRQAANLLNLSERQTIRLKKKYLTTGSTGLVHGLTGKKSNNTGDDEVYTRAMVIIKEEYPDFGPTLATEHLLIDHNLRVNRESLRQKMIEEGIWKDRKRQKQKYRSKRIPKSSYGEMVQYDGSYEHWLEDRGATGEICMLMGVDDAKSHIQLIVFSSDEGTRATFSFWKEYLLKYGKPLSIYLDNFTTYKSPLVQKGIDPNARTQFGRAMQELGIELIYANSPQAKGRVERRFGNLQDRLIKEMRLSNIDSIEEANVYANELFIPWFNQRYGKEAKTPQNLHQKLTADESANLDSILSIQTVRIVQNDFTVRHSGKYYQLLESVNIAVFRKDEVVIEYWLDGSERIRKGKHYLEYEVLAEVPKMTKKLSRKLLLPRKQANPDPDHPFKRRSYERYLRDLAAKQK